MAKPKLDDVARVAGVSPTTVSRVLNNRGYISQATRDRVQQAMAEINYRPNAIARSLQESKSHVIGLVFPSVANPFYGELAFRIESKLADHDYKVVLCNSQDHPETEARYLDMLLANQVDGVITGAHSDVVANAPYLAAPLVTIDREETGRYPNIRCDNVDGARQATRALLEGGARRVVHFTSRISDHNLRQRGYRQVIAEAGLQPEVVELGFDTPPEEHRAHIYAYLEQHPDIDAVFASNDSYATMAVQWAYKTGKAVPGDFQVVGFDGTPTVRSLLPHLATVVQPLDAIAEQAVTHLLRLIEQQADPAACAGKTEVLPVTLHRGATLR
ncbi:LacI family DNA-binding transcriptional regulator [Rothia aerolata]|uniref:LacI family transcriptional regulator n=1 Tax=Rothia aerolata TaxID=1812262 RepID=A0A917IQF1_9MICC|nr:LacI family DNA-binding transcriptional regulator [Rothia aerolata]GGH60704.1 LacI family transcriptional regulator [Rothia aerolata]